MAHFAQIDENKIVMQVIVVNNSDCLDANGKENEAVGAGFCAKLFGGVWKQTSYNATFRKNYAGIGFIYDEMRDAFIPPKPYQSWLLDEVTCRWISPVPKPETGGPYEWDEIAQQWITVT